MADDEKTRDPSALPLADAARMLGIDLQALEADIQAGAPTNPDGTIHLVHYAAWLNLALKENSDGEA